MLALALALGTCLAQPAAAQTRPQPELQELQDLLPQGRLVGSGGLRIFGFKIYDAQLWASPGLRADNFATQALALELRYLRAFEGQAVAERSISEMRRAGPLSEELADRWTAALRSLLPDVKNGDRIMGVHRPGVGATFWMNGKPLGEIRDAEFARRFFGIWLSPATSEPDLRKALLAGAGS